MAKPDRSDRDIEGVVLEGMARALWVHAYTIWALEVEPPPVQGGGGWDEIAPNNTSTWKASMQAAKALVKVLGEANQLGRYPLATIFRRAVGHIPAGKALYPYTEGYDTDAVLYTLGQDLAHVCMGTRDPENSPLPFTHDLVIPQFTVELDDDGRDLSWDGGVSWPTRNAPRRRPVRADDDDDDEVSEADLDALADAGRVIRPGTTRLTPAIAEAIIAYRDEIQDALSEEARARLAARIDYTFRTGVLDTLTEIALDSIMESLPRENPSHNWSGSKVQSLIFDRATFTAQRAKEWARAHGYRHADVDTTERSHRIRQFAPIEGLPCRTMRFAPGIQAVICATRNPCDACEPHENPSGAMEVLLIEDEPGTQRATTRMIKRIFPGAQVLLVDNYGAAIGNLETHDVAWVISDVNILGDKSGIDIFEWVKANQPHLVDKYVFFTGGNPQVEQMHYRYLEKPATVDDMRRAIAAPAPGIRRPGASEHRSVAPPIAQTAQGLTTQAVADAVHAVAPSIRETAVGDRSAGRFGPEKVFVAALWRKLSVDPRFRGMTLAQFKRRLVAANRDMLLSLARADLVGAMDPTEVQTSEIEDMGATFHFVLDPTARGR